jgi:hypothetical protein
MHNSISDSAPQDNVLGSKSFIERYEHRRGRTFMITLNIAESQNISHYV